MPIQKNTHSNSEYLKNCSKVSSVAFQTFKLALINDNLPMAEEIHACGKTVPYLGNGGIFGSCVFYSCVGE